MAAATTASSPANCACSIVSVHKLMQRGMSSSRILAFRLSCEIHAAEGAFVSLSGCSAFRVLGFPHGISGTCHLRRGSHEQQREYNQSKGPSHTFRSPVRKSSVCRPRKVCRRPKDVELRVRFQSIRQLEYDNHKAFAFFRLSLPRVFNNLCFN